MAIEFQVLGSVEARIDGVSVDVGPARQRCVLAALLIDANQVVQAQQLIDRVWGDRVPHRVRDTLQTYLSRLRKVLASADGVAIVRRAGGYVLAVESMAVDLHRFRHLVARARGAIDEQDAAACYAQAFRLWRAELCAGMDTAWFNRIRDDVEAERHAARLDHVDLRLRQGRHGELLAELAASAAGRPWDERLTGQLMLALYRSGRQADALAHYQRIRSRLAEELGADPGAPLRDLHQRILTADSTLLAAATDVRSESTRTPVPAQLPADIALFTGRVAQLNQLLANLPDDGKPLSSPVVICVIDGMAGVGKTALAVHAAHQVKHRFPGGQLHVNLRGYASATAVRPLEALTRCLHALGVPGEQVPADVDEAASLYRTMLANRRVLIVLDNAASADQVRPLLPGGSGSLVLVTSRDRLAGLTATDGAHRITLDVLDPADARVLLTRMLGAQRAQAEPDSVDELARVCAHLPMALRIAAANLIARTHIGIGEFAAELRRGRLAALAVDGDEHSAVRTAFDLSYARLNPECRQLFGLLGLVPGPDFTAEAAAALIGGTVPLARGLLGRLATAHLVHEHAAGRYQFIGLLCEYAAQQAHAEHDDAALRAATQRLLDFYLHTVANFCRILPDPGQKLDHIGLPPPVAAPLVFGGYAEALGWCDTERANLIAIVRLAECAGFDRHAWQLTGLLMHYLVIRMHVDDWFTTHRLALRAAHRLGNPHAKATTLYGLGLAYLRLRDHRRAIKRCEHALRLYREVGNQYRASSTLTNLALAHYRLGQYAQSAARGQEALLVARAVGSRPLEAAALHALAYTYLELGRPGEALANAQHALTMWRATGNRDHEALTLRVVGLIHQALRHDREADVVYRRAVSLHRDAGAPYDEAVVLVNLGDLDHQRNDDEGAQRNWLRAHQLFSELSHPAAHEVATRLERLPRHTDPSHETGRWPIVGVPAPIWKRIVHRVRPVPVGPGT